jgi:hypothetical protein
MAERIVVCLTSAEQEYQALQGEDARAAALRLGAEVEVLFADDNALMQIASRPASPLRCGPGAAPFSTCRGRPTRPPRASGSRDSRRRPATPRTSCGS